MPKNNKLKFYKRTAEKLYKQLEDECTRQTYIVLGSACIALWRYWGWRTKKLNSLIDISYEAWNECKDYGTSKSMIQILDEETGIELKLAEDGRSWRELDFLNGNLNIYGNYMTLPQLVALRQGQIKWVGVIIQASLYLALHRKERFGCERIQRLLKQMFEIQDEFENNADRLLKACRELTDIHLEAAITEIRKEPPNDEKYFEMSAAEVVRQIQPT